MDELELLRDMARAVVARMRADAAFRSQISANARKPADRMTGDDWDAAIRLGGVAADRERELMEALQRLAEVNPDFAPD